MKYKNGNAEIEIKNDGTRIIEFDNELKLEYPLNIDIRVSTKCSFGQKPDGNYVLCDYCHESAKTNGIECDYELLQNKLDVLPAGIELAIGCNQFTDGLLGFLIWCYNKNYICNLTVNQGHLHRDISNIMVGILSKVVKGLGISYRNSLQWLVPEILLKYPNTVFHVIAGIDEIEDIEKLGDKGVKKILVLGEKDFGFNSNKVNLDSKNHNKWVWWVSKLFDKFEVVSFDNLAIEQLNIKRFFDTKNWSIFYQGEYSMYIDAVNGIFAPSSRSNNKTSWDELTIKHYFKGLGL